jgi:hypothetical protein
VSPENQPRKSIGGQFFNFPKNSKKTLVVVVVVQGDTSFQYCQFSDNNHAW